MANKRIKDLPAATETTVGDILPIDGTTTRGITVENFLGDSLNAIKGLTSAADKGIQFTGSGTAATYDLTTAGKALLDDADAAAQRTTLGLVIGTNVQAYDADLAAIAGLTSAADKGIYFTGSATASTFDLTSFGRTLVGNASASDARSDLGLVIGTDVQAYDAELAAIAGLTSAADKLPYFTGSETASLADFTSFGRTLVANANAADARADLDLEPGTDVQAYSARLADIAGITWTQGDILYYNGSNLVDLGPGTSGQFLKTQGAGANPVWDSVPGGGDMLASTYDPANKAEQVLTVSDILDEDDFASDSATKVPSQQSTKAYVDAIAGSYRAVYRPEDYGAVGDGTTDDSAAFIAMWDAMKADGGLIITEPKIYYMGTLATGTVLDFRRSAASSSSVGGQVGITNYMYGWLGYGTVLDFKDISGDAVALAIGATAQANANEFGHWQIYGVKLVGPHTTTPDTSDVPATTTTGLKLHWAYNCVIRDVQVSLFYKGIHGDSTFPITASGVVGLNNYIGLHLDDDSTKGTWIGCAFRSGRFGVVAAPVSTNKVVLNQTFIGLLIEGNKVGCVLDPNSGSADGISGFIFDNPYLENITYDGFRVGRDWNAADASDSGDNRSRGCKGLRWFGGTWDAGGSAWGSAGHDAIRFQSSAGGDASPSRPRNILLQALPLIPGTAFDTTHTSNIDTQACGA